jgi:hypothetical protein
VQAQAVVWAVWVVVLWRVVVAATMMRCLR